MSCNVFLFILDAKVFITCAGEVTTLLLHHCSPCTLGQISLFCSKDRNSFHTQSHPDGQFARLQVKEYETDPYFILLSQNMTTDCLLISVFLVPPAQWFKPLNFVQNMDFILNAIGHPYVQFVRSSSLIVCKQKSMLVQTSL